MSNYDFWNMPDLQLCLQVCGDVGMAHTHKASKYCIDLCMNAWIQPEATYHGLQILHSFYIHKAVCQGWTWVHAIILVVYLAAYFSQVKYILQRWTNRGNGKLIWSFQYELHFLILCPAMLGLRLSVLPSRADCSIFSNWQLHSRHKEEKKARKQANACSLTLSGEGLLLRLNAIGLCLELLCLNWSYGSWGNKYSPQRLFSGWDVMYR